MNLDGRIITIDQIHGHLAAMQWNGSFQPKYGCLHNTSVPDQATYRKWVAAGRPTMEQWLRNLASYYAGMGWKSMPHAFVLPDGRIGLGAPFNVKGTHTPSWNGFSIGVETLGEFEREAWVNTPVERATVALFGELCLRLNWQPDQYIRGVRGIHFHKEDPGTTHRSCPGRNVDKVTFVQKVLAYMGDAGAARETDRNGHIHEIPEHVLEAETNSLTKEQLTSWKWLGERLVAKGYPNSADGVKAFQKAHPPMVVDSVAGPITRIALSK